ncbi:MAG: Sporulation initiation phosphotransferase F [Deltaproteobacteria bacterium ADurb.Bin510]|jgi:DNA-binding NtrC family response regulator|nr:MAG: Sporulation initiation phosphotransferase F [Deltaproteobacteria bacterium ADurb.Bin510]
MARILVVDDDCLIQELLRRTLEDQGHEVALASNGCEAMVIYEDSQVDLVITDMVMPKKNGIELIRDLTDRDPAVKIFAMSGGGHLSSNDYLRIAEIMGVKRTFAKPIEIRPLLNAVTEVLC